MHEIQSLTHSIATPHQATGCHGASTTGSPSDLPLVIGAASPALLCGLDLLVAGADGIRVAGKASSLEQLLLCSRNAAHGVALVDPLLGRQGVRGLLESIRAEAPVIRVVLISDENQPHVVRDAMRSGACGFVSKAAHAQEIRLAVLAAAQGRRYISADTAGHLADACALEELTQREVQVLGLLAQGDCNKEISRALDVTVGTVKTHVRAIMSKLAARSRTDAVHKGYRFGLIRLHS